MDNLPEFKSFNKILHIGKLYMSITQKLHGTNAQILIKDNEIFAGSRTRWLTPEDDNYGFCKWVMENKEVLINTLGEGAHYGEWCGPGINAGEGLKEKTFCLFNWQRWIGKELPKNVRTVPMIYKGNISIDVINNSMNHLKQYGSFLVPGYMHPEGIVIQLEDNFYKNVFEAEETQWSKNQTVKKITSLSQVNVSHLLQPLRLEKLLSKEENLVRDYPKTITQICKAYVQDLEEEQQFKSDPEEMAAEKKSLGKEIFLFVKSIMQGKNNVSAT